MKQLAVGNEVLPVLSETDRNLWVELTVGYNELNTAVIKVAKAWWRSPCDSTDAAVPGRGVVKLRKIPIRAINKHALQRDQLEAYMRGYHESLAGKPPIRPDDWNETYTGLYIAGYNYARSRNLVDCMTVTEAREFLTYINL